MFHLLNNYHHSDTKHKSRKSKDLIKVLIVVFILAGGVAVLTIVKLVIHHENRQSETAVHHMTGTGHVAELINLMIRYFNGNFKTKIPTSTQSSTDQSTISRKDEERLKQFFRFRGLIPKREQSSGEQLNRIVNLDALRPIVRLPKTWRRQTVVFTKILRILVQYLTESVIIQLIYLEL